MKLNKRKTIMKTSALLSVAGFSSVFVSSCSVLTYDSSVQLIVSDNSSQLADQSFSESTYDGMKAFLEETTGSKLPEAKNIRENNGIWKRPGEDDDSRRTAYKYSVNNGAKIIVATGFNQQNALQQLSSNNEQYKIWKDYFKNTGFVFVDGSMEKGGEYNSTPDNIASVSFRADDGSFLAGVATAVFLNYNIKSFKTGPSSKGLGVSSFVGLALSSTLNYFNGFRLGIHYWNTVLQPLIKTVDGSTLTEKIKWINPIGNNGDWNMTNFLSGTFSATEQKATTLALAMRSNGANAIFPIAGPQTNLVVSEIASDTASSGVSRSIVIGVDVAQENTDSLKTKLDWVGSNTVGNNQILQFSSVKNLNHATSSILNAIVHNQNSSNSNGWAADKNQVNNDSSSKSSDTWYGLGWNNVGTLNNGAVGVSDAGLKYLIDPYFWVNNTSSTDSNTSTNLSTWTNSELSYSTLTLKDLVDNHNGKYHASQLSISDPIISKYAKLLSGNIKTPESVSLQTSTKLKESSTNTKIDLGNNSSTDTSSKGINGVDGKGSWKIENDSDGKNHTISKTLSSLLPGISGGDYAVASNAATFVGSENTSISFPNEKPYGMFFRKN